MNTCPAFRQSREDRAFLVSVSQLLPAQNNPDARVAYLGMAGSATLQHAMTEFIIAIFRRKQ